MHFAAVSILVNTQPSSSVWYFDFGASNHLPFSTDHLFDIKSSIGKMHVHAADGEKLLITAIGDVSHSLTSQNIFISPSLSANLLSIGQLVNDVCTISFSSSGCVVQDQVSGMVIAKGPKCKRMFPLQLSLQMQNKPEFAIFCSSSQNNWKLGHIRLGHPNVKTMSSLFRPCLIN